MPQLVQEKRCKSSPSVISMYHELSDPADNFAIVSPAASERITSKLVVDGDPHVRVCGVRGQVIGSKSTLAESNVTTLVIISR